jgi:very-short-patch-repair endonuclease
VSNKSAGEDELARQLDALNIPYEREFRFAPPRRWRADFHLAGPWLVEVEGGVWTGGHRRGAEANKDTEKHNAVVMLGWKCLRFTPHQVETGEAIGVIEAALATTPETDHE